MTGVQRTSCDPHAVFTSWCRVNKARHTQHSYLRAYPTKRRSSQGYHGNLSTSVLYFLEPFHSASSHLGIYRRFTRHAQARIPFMQRMLSYPEGYERSEAYRAWSGRQYIAWRAKPGFLRSPNLFYLSMTQRCAAKSAARHSLSPPSGSLLADDAYQHGCARPLQQLFGPRCQAVLEGVYGAGQPRMHHKSTDLAGRQEVSVLCVRSGAVMKARMHESSKREVRSS